MPVTLMQSEKVFVLTQLKSIKGWFKRIMEDSHLIDTLYLKYRENHRADALAVIFMLRLNGWMVQEDSLTHQSIKEFHCVKCGKTFKDTAVGCCGALKDTTYNGYTVQLRKIGALCAYQQELLADGRNADLLLYIDQEDQRQKLRIRLQQHRG